MVQGYFTIISPERVVGNIRNIDRLFSISCSATGASIWHDELAINGLNKGCWHTGRYSMMHINAIRIE